MREPVRGREHSGIRMPYAAEPAPGEAFRRDVVGDFWHWPDGVGGVDADAVECALWKGWQGPDPVPWLLESDDPSARWVTLTALLDRSPDDPEVRAVHDQVVVADQTTQLVQRLPDWDAEQRISGHESPMFAPNLLNLLAELGVGVGDFDEVEHLLDQLLSHQEPSGRFPSFGRVPGVPTPVWGALLCDSHAVIEVLVRFGRQEDARVMAGLRRMADDLTMTTQGRAWPCLPHSTAGWRGPGRKGDFCPMVTVQALRTFARVPPDRRPERLIDAAHVVLRAWRHGESERPYQFGHGRRFRTGKWPSTWYSALTVLDALSRYPALWRDEPRGEDACTLGSLAGALVEHAVSPSGTVTPASAYRGFERYSFGQKKRPSAFATARTFAVLHRLHDLGT